MLLHIGLDEEEHYTSAYELALITDYALKNEKFAKIVNTKTCQININGQTKMLSNTNELLGNLNGVDGVKTGFTNGAGRCLVTSITRNNHQIICVVLGADTKKIRTTDSVKLIEYAFLNYEYINAKEKIEQKYNEWLQKEASNINYNKAILNKDIENKKILNDEMTNKVNSDNPKYELIGEEITWIPIKKGKEKDIQISIDYKKSLEAPVYSGEIIGSIEMKLDEEVLLKKQIILKQDIQKKQIIDYFFDFIKQSHKYLLSSMKQIF